MTKKDRVQFAKLVVMISVINGIIWVYCSYILAWFGKEQIAESLSKTAVVEIIGVVMIYCLKSLFENLSKNNSWPDKPKESKEDDSV